MSKVIVSIEARTGSTRLPEKTLKEVVPRLTLLEIVYNRFKNCKKVDDIWIATTTNPGDDGIAGLCENKGFHYFRGSEENVLDRVVNTAQKAGADCIVQAGGDGPYAESKLIDELITVYESSDFDFVSNDFKLTYPLGIYGHIVRVDTLAEINCRNDLKDADKEDVVRFLWERPNEFKLMNLIAPDEYNFPELRLTIDYSEDFELLKEIVNHFPALNYSINDIISLYKKEPHLFQKVRNLVQKSTPSIGNIYNGKNKTGSVYN